MKIRYDGIGGKCGKEYSVDEFLNIMKTEFQNKEWRHELELIPYEENDALHFKDWILPDDFCFFTFDDWIEYSGATIVK
jgi:hypothetical protein